jgi:hypothetical protein
MVKRMKVREKGNTPGPEQKEKENKQNKKMKKENSYI